MIKNATLTQQTIFTIDYKDIEGRLDPEYLLFCKKTENANYDTRELGKCLISMPQYGSNQAGIERIDENEPRYIRITDIDENGNLIDDIGVTAENVEEKYILKNNDLLFARSGATVGKAYLHKTENVKYPCFFAGYMIRFKIDEKIVKPDYIYALTQLSKYKKWVKAIQRTTGQPNINAEEYKSYKIPIPPLEIQTQIVEKFNKAKEQQNESKRKSKQILSSIDNYILDKLGITLPDEDNSLENRIFVRDFQTVSKNGRLDPAIYNNFYLNFDFILTSLKSIKFSNLIDIITKGETPVYISDNLTEFNIPFLKVQNIEIEGIKGEISYIPEFVHKRMKRSQLFGGEILFTMAGSIGVVTIFPLDFGIANINQAIAKITLKKINLINKNYLVEILNSLICKLRSKRILTVTAQPNINFEQIKSIKIPFPPLEVQNQIAEHIKEMRKQAKEIEQQANEELEKIKTEIEKIIFE